jgi:sporulation protein YlmC with PRC-barrel domain
VIATELLRRRVVDHDGVRVGRVIDLRFVLDGPPDGVLAAARLHGLVVGRHGGSFLGYERTDVRAPWLVADLLRWRNRGAFLVHWADLDLVGDDTVRLHAGATRWSPRIMEGS